MGTKAELPCWALDCFSACRMVYMCLSGRKGSAGAGRWWEQGAPCVGKMAGEGAAPSTPVGRGGKRGGTGPGCGSSSLSPGRLLYKSHGSNSFPGSGAVPPLREEQVEVAMIVLLSCTVPQKGLQKESLQECIISLGSFACQTPISFGEILLPHNSTRADSLQDLQGHTPDLPFRPTSGV